MKKTGFTMHEMILALSMIVGMCVMVFVAYPRVSQAASLVDMSKHVRKLVLAMNSSSQEREAAELKSFVEQRDLGFSFSEKQSPTGKVYLISGLQKKSADTLEDDCVKGVGPFCKSIQTANQGYGLLISGVPAKSDYQTLNGSERDEVERLLTVFKAFQTSLDDEKGRKLRNLAMKEINRRDGRLMIAETDSGVKVDYSEERGKVIIKEACDIATVQCDLNLAEKAFIIKIKTSAAQPQKEMGFDEGFNNMVDAYSKFRKSRSPENEERWTFAQKAFSSKDEISIEVSSWSKLIISGPSHKLVRASNLCKKASVSCSFITDLKMEVNFDRHVDGWDVAGGEK